MPKRLNGIPLILVFYCNIFYVSLQESDGATEEEESVEQTNAEYSMVSI